MKKNLNRFIENLRSGRFWINAMNVCSAMLLLIFVYCINKPVTILKILTKMGFEVDCQILDNVLLSGGVYLILMAIATTLSFLAIKKLKAESVNEISNINPAGNTMLPIYVAYIFIALSIGNSTALWITYAILSLLIIIFNTYTINPILFFVGYRFYIAIINQKSVIIITKTPIGTGDEYKNRNLIKLNEYTYIEKHE